MGGGEGEGEAEAAGGDVLDGDGTAHGGYDAAHQGEAEAGAAADRKSVV